MLDALSTVVSGDATKTTGVLNVQKQKLFAVREGVSCLLDVARRTYSETVDDIMGECPPASPRPSLDRRCVSWCSPHILPDTQPPRVSVG